MPPTTGGSTIGKVVSPRTTALPRKVLRARSQASGNPNSSAITVLASEAMMESPSASSELLFVMMPKTLPPWGPGDHPDRREHEEQRGQRGQDGQQRVEGLFLLVHPGYAGGANPKLASTAWPWGLST